ncbi:unnamed protein product, partial [marine sediment metagenome]
FSVLSPMTGPPDTEQDPLSKYGVVMFQPALTILLSTLSITP